MKKLLGSIGYNSWIYRKGKERDVCVLETLADFLDFSFDPLELKTKIEKASYVRGFFDAEGGIPKDLNARFYVQLSQKDRTKMTKIKKLLNDVGIECGEIHNPSVRVDPDYWRMYVSSKFYEDFIKVIYSWHPRKKILLDNRVKI